MTTVELCRLVARAEFRPFRKTDYYGFAGVSREGPHEIAEVDEWLVVRDGDHVVLYLSSTEDPTGETAWAVDSKMQP